MPHRRPWANSRLHNARERLDRFLAARPAKATHAVADMIHKLIDEALDSEQPEQGDVPLLRRFGDPHSAPMSPPEGSKTGTYG